MLILPIFVVLAQISTWLLGQDMAPGVPGSGLYDANVVFLIQPLRL